jgi:hypothetical protein
MKTETQNSGNKLKRKYIHNIETKRTADSYLLQNSKTSTSLLKKQP